MVTTPTSSNEVIVLKLATIRYLIDYMEVVEVVHVVKECSFCYIVFPNAVISIEGLIGCFYSVRGCTTFCTSA